MALLALLPVHAKGDDIAGIYGGWAHGFGDSFQWRSYGATSYQTAVRWVIGGYIQRNLNKKFALAIDYGFQVGWEKSKGGYGPGSQSTRVFGSFSFDGIIKVIDTGKISLYCSAGVGTQLRVGAGLKFPLKGTKAKLHLRTTYGFNYFKHDEEDHLPVLNTVAGIEFTGKF
jgi:hypothetical protein